METKVGTWGSAALQGPHVQLGTAPDQGAPVRRLRAGEIAVKLKPEELAPFAAPVVERLVPILQSMTSMPRSIVENRRAQAPAQRAAGSRRASVRRTPPHACACR